MALDNLRCPQFVDFTNRATFDIHDGADVYFEKGVVGELGLGFDDDINNPNNDDGIDELIAALNNATNLQTNNNNNKNNKNTNYDKEDSGISEAISISPNQINNNNNNDNIITKKNKTIDSDKNELATTKPTNQNKNQTQTKGNTPNRKRTNSNCSNKSIDSNKVKLSTSKNQSQAQQTNKNIVKKTIAKVTAAFKTTKLGIGETNQLKLKTKSTNQNRDKKKHDGPLKVEYNSNTNNNNNNDNNTINKQENKQITENNNNNNNNCDIENLEHETTTMSSNNRRCSSVPRTLKEKQALNKQITLGEKIQNFFSRDTHKSLKTSNEERNKLKNIPDNEDENKQQNEQTKRQQNQQYTHKSRKLTDDETKLKPSNNNNNKGNTSKLGNNSQLQRQNTLTEPKSPNFSTKPRQHSCDRKENIPMLPYQGVKFIPKLSHKYNSSEPFSNLEERAKQLNAKKESKKLQEIENGTNKPMIVTNEKNNSKIPGLNSSLNKNQNNNYNNNNKENISICSTTALEQSNINSDTKTCGNDSILSNKAANTSTLSNCSRKRVDLKPMQLHTQTRAQKRHQYDQYLKDKERMAELIKKNLEMQKIIESKNEIQKLRSQLLFKSKPFKQIKPMEVRPSEKPLTEPKSPHLGLLSATTSSSKLNITNNKTTTRSLSQDNLRLN